MNAAWKTSISRSSEFGGVRIRYGILLLLIMALVADSSASEYKFSDPPPPTVITTNALKPNPGNGIDAGVSNSSSLMLATNGSPTNVLTALDDKYRLTIGDRLSFRIVEDEEDVKPLVVADSGEVEVPYLGRFPAVGKTCLELARSLKENLEKEYYYQATVVLAVDSMTKSRGKIYLVGPVRSAGPQDVPSDEVLTLSKAILRAGGFTDFAEKRKVRVTRKSLTDGAPEEVFTVNVEEVLEKGKMQTDLPLQPGDLIYVPERLIRF